MTQQSRSEPAESRRSNPVAAVFKDVTVAFDSYRVRALNDVSFSVRRGEILGVLGGSGSGKSTVLRLLAGKLRPTEGTVRVFGRSPCRAGARARIGFLAGRPAASAKFGWRKWLGLLSSTKSHSAQTGKSHPAPETRRAQLRQAVLGNRDLIVLDDAFEGLDPAGQSEVKALVAQLASKGKTIVLGTASLAEATDICDRLCVLHEGKLQALGTLAEMLTCPDALRFLAPVLPAALTQQLLTVIRTGFSRWSEVKTQKSSRPDERLSASKTTITSTAADAVPAQAESPVSGVNYAWLEALTKASTGGSGSGRKGRN